MFYYIEKAQRYSIAIAWVAIRWNPSRISLYLESYRQFVFTECSGGQHSSYSPQLPTLRPPPGCSDGLRIPNLGSRRCGDRGPPFPVAPYSDRHHFATPNGTGCSLGVLGFGRIGVPATGPTDLWMSSSLSFPRLTHSSRSLTPAARGAMGSPHADSNAQRSRSGNPPMSNCENAAATVVRAFQIAVSVVIPFLLILSKKVSVSRRSIRSAYSFSGCPWRSR